MTFKLESMSDDVLKSVAKSKNKVMAEKAKVILAKRICVVEQPGKRTGLPKMRTMADEFGFDPQSFKKFVEENSHNLP